MSYQVLTEDQYKALPLEGRVEEMKKWIEDCFVNHRSIIRSIAGTLPEMHNDIAEVINAPFKDLPKLINNYEEDSVAHIILKHRLEKNIVTCDNSILDLDAVGECIRDVYLNYCDSEDDNNTIRNLASSNDDLQTLCRIFGFEALQKSLKAWQP